jgi:hypothetical protein
MNNSIINASLFLTCSFLKMNNAPAITRYTVVFVFLCVLC